MNLQDTANWPKYRLPTLTYQSRSLVTLGSSLSATSYRSFARSSWHLMSTSKAMLYAEQLADELGLYEDNPLGRLGRLKDLQLCACRLVVDTGLHTKHWSRNQAIAWMTERLGSDQMTSEIDRYIVSPGQATSYKSATTKSTGCATRPS